MMKTNKDMATINAVFEDGGTLKGARGSTKYLALRTGEDAYNVIARVEPDGSGAVKTIDCMVTKVTGGEFKATRKWGQMPNWLNLSAYRPYAHGESYVNDPYLLLKLVCAATDADADASAAPYAGALWADNKLFRRALADVQETLFRLF